MEHQKRNPLKIIGYAVLILLLTAAVYTFVMSAMGKVPSFFGYRVLHIVSGSMEPQIPTGSFILIRGADAGELEAGDIITFYSEDPMIYGKPNTHRILEIRERDGGRAFITKGDANDTPDAYPVGEAQLIGRYVGDIPLLTKFGGFLTSPWIFFIIVVIPAAVLFVLEIRNVVRKAKEGPPEGED